MKRISKICYYGSFLIHGAVLAGMGYGVTTVEFWALTLSMAAACIAPLGDWGQK